MKHPDELKLMTDNLAVCWQQQNVILYWILKEENNNLNIIPGVKVFKGIHVFYTHIFMFSY